MLTIFILMYTMVAIGYYVSHIEKEAPLWYTLICVAFALFWPILWGYGKSEQHTMLKKLVDK